MTRTPLALIHRTSSDGSAGRAFGPYRITALIEPAEEGGGTAYRVRIEPGRRTAVSYHRVAEEFYFVLAGRGTAVLDGVEYPLAPGDFLRLPPGTTHGFITGDEPLDLLDVHVPGCRPDRDVYFVGEAPQGFGDAKHAAADPGRRPAG